MKVKVKVPATSANLGPGFDVAGLALTLYNTFTFELSNQGINITGCPKQFCNEENMTYQAFKRAAKVCGLDYHGVNIECSGDVPYTRGLGSSSTCIVAGIVGAFAFKDKVEDRQAILELATAIEGHPDNVAPAILGGLVVGTNVAQHFDAVEAPLPPYDFVAYIPAYCLATKKARAVLPRQLDYHAATHASAVANTLVAALFKQNYSLVKELMEADDLHEQYRAQLVPELMTIRQLGHIYNAATYLSGAGPTIMTMITPEKTAAFIEALRKNGLSDRIEVLHPDRNGVVVDDQ